MDTRQIDIERERGECKRGAVLYIAVAVAVYFLPFFLWLAGSPNGDDDLDAEDDLLLLLLDAVRDESSAARSLSLPEVARPFALRPPIAAEAGRRGFFAAPAAAEDFE